MNTKDPRAEQFGLWLQHQLRRKEWKQSEFARRLGKDPGMVGNWVRGNRLPSSESLEEIADVLGYKVSDLLVIAGRMPRELEEDPASDKARLMGMLQRVSLADPTRVKTLEFILAGYLDDDRAEDNSAVPGPAS